MLSLGRPKAIRKETKPEKVNVRGGRGKARKGRVKALRSDIKPSSIPNALSIAPVRRFISKGGSEPRTITHFYDPVPVTEVPITVNNTRAIRFMETTLKTNSCGSLLGESSDLEEEGSGLYTIVATWAVKSLEKIWM